MATTQITTRQIKGEVTALRPRKTAANQETIDIAGGTYASGRVFPGAFDLTHEDWDGASAEFFVYLNHFDQLILNDLNGFPAVSTRIARVVIEAGTIIAVVDERATVNGTLDAYEIHYLDNGNNFVLGDDVQEALDSIDGYLSTISTGKDLTKFIDLDVAGGIKNGYVSFTEISGTPTVEFSNLESAIGRIRYSLSVPSDYRANTDINIKLFWSVPSTGVGTVAWRIRYKVLKSGIDDVDISPAIGTFIQPTLGIANRVIDTGINLTIPGNLGIKNKDVLIINIEREKDANDTYNEKARLHHVRLEYEGRGVI